MVVRSSVVDALAQLKDTESVPLLAAELAEKRNFYRGQSSGSGAHHRGDGLDRQQGSGAVSDFRSERGQSGSAPARLLRLKQLEPTAPPATDAVENCAARWIAWQREGAKPAQSPVAP